MSCHEPRGRHNLRASCSRTVAQRFPKFVSKLQKNQSLVGCCFNRELSRVMLQCLVCGEIVKCALDLVRFSRTAS
jgi:hypothetical protein